MDQLQRKQLSKQDVKLLEVLGFSETLNILMEERTKLNSHNEHLNHIAGLDGSLQLGEYFNAQIEDDLVKPMLGGTSVINSTLKRNSRATKSS